MFMSVLTSKRLSLFAFMFELLPLLPSTQTYRNANWCLCTYMYIDSRYSIEVQLLLQVTLLLPIHTTPFSLTSLLKL